MHTFARACVWIGLLPGVILFGLAACAVPAPVFLQADPPLAAPPPTERQRASLRLELALAYHRQGQDAVALEEVDRALAHDPRWASAWNLRGLIQHQQADAAAALASLERARALAPQDADIAHNLAWVRCQQTGPHSAGWDALFDQALALPGAQLAKTWTARALCQQRAGQPVQAEASLLQALAFDPASPRALWPLAQLLCAQGRWQDCSQRLDQLHARQPASAASAWLALRSARKLDNAQAEKHWAQQLRRDFGRSREAHALDKGWFDE